MANPKPVSGFHTNPERINRKGAPKGISITTLVKEALEQIPEGKKETHKALLVKTILKKAIEEGDVKMAQEIWRQIDGSPKQHADVKLKHEFGDVPDEELDEELSGVISRVSTGLAALKGKEKKRGK